MANKPKGSTDPVSPPASFPNTPPPLSLDQSFTLPTIMTMQHQLGGITKQLEHIEKKLDDIAEDVKVHGRWLFAANAVVVIIVAIIAFLAPRIWDLIMTKPPTH